MAFQCLFIVKSSVCGGSLRSRTLNDEIGADWMQVTVFIDSSSMKG